MTDTRPQTENVKISNGVKRMFGHDLQWWFDLANTAYLGALIIGALSAFAIALTSWFVIKWGGEIQENKDTAFEKYKLESAERTAQLENEAAQARLEQERLKAQLAWRILSEATGTNLIQQLRPLSSQPRSIKIEYVSNDPEAHGLAIQFAKVFQKAGWTIGLLGVTHSHALVTGLFVPDEGGTHTNNVRAAFKASGITFSTEPIPQPDIAVGNPSPATATIFIGTKPPQSEVQVK